MPAFHTLCEANAAAAYGCVALSQTDVSTPLSVHSSSIFGGTQPEHVSLRGCRHEGSKLRARFRDGMHPFGDALNGDLHDVLLGRPLTRATTTPEILPCSLLQRQREAVGEAGSRFGGRRGLLDLSAGRASLRGGGRVRSIRIVGRFEGHVDPFAVVAEPASSMHGQKRRCLGGQRAWCARLLRRCGIGIGRDRIQHGHRRSMVRPMHVGVPTTRADAGVESKAVAAPLASIDDSRNELVGRPARFAKPRQPPWRGGHIRRSEHDRRCHRERVRLQKRSGNGLPHPCPGV